jgi:hypothetical protein
MAARRIGIDNSYGALAQGYPLTPPHRPERNPNSRKRRA